MHILLDLDGTLTDPKIGITRSIAFALTQLNAPVPDEATLTDCIGPPLSHSFAKLLPQPSPHKIEAAIAHYRTRFSTQGLFENRLYPGIHSAIAHLVQNGASLHLATSKPHVFARQILEHFKLANYFTSIHGSELDGTRAEKPELIAYLLKTEAIAPELAIMVGDRSYDILGATANNVAAVGVLWGYGSKAELIQAGAQSILAKPNELSCISALPILSSK